MLKVAVVGVGGISGAHIPVWKKQTDAELVAICDIRPERLAIHPERRGYTDFDEMLEKEEIDILDICLPTYLHVEFAIKALERGINVICEKPISIKKEDVKRVYDTARKNGVKFMVAQLLRFEFNYDYIKQLYDNQTYGKLLSGNMRRLGAIPKWSWDNWMKDEKRSGLVPFDLHIHDLDFMVYAFGAPKSSDIRRVKRPEQDYISMTYQYDDFFITAETAWYAGSYPFGASYRFQFEKAVVELYDGEITVYEVDKSFKPDREASTMETGNIGLPSTDAFANELEYFKNCVMSGKDPERVKEHEIQSVLDILTSM